MARKKKTKTKRGSKRRTRRSNPKAYYLVPYVVQDEDDWSILKAAIVRASSKKLARSSIDDAIIEDQEEEFWGPIWETDVFGGSSPERAEADFYYVSGEPEEEDWQTPVRAIRILEVQEYPTLEAAREAATDQRVPEQRISEWRADPRGGLHAIKRTNPALRPRRTGRKYRPKRRRGRSRAISREDNGAGLGAFIGSSIGTLAGLGVGSLPLAAAGSIVGAGVGGYAAAEDDRRKRGAGGGAVGGALAGPIGAAVGGYIGGKRPDKGRNPRRSNAALGSGRALTKADKAVISAFLDKKSGSSKKLSTDGKRLDGNWMGGDRIAVWKGKKIDLPDIGSRAAQQVQRAVRKEAPANWIAEDNPRGAMAKKSKKRGRKRNSTDEILQFLLESHEQSEGYTGSSITPDVESEWDKFDDDVHVSLGRHLTEDQHAAIMEHPQGSEYVASDVYMTITESGAGIWDGRDPWQQVLTDKQLDDLSKKLKKDLSKYADFTGAGSLEEAFGQAVLDTGSATNPKRGKKRTSKRGKGGKKRSSKRRRNSAPKGFENEYTELSTYIDNDYTLYSGQRKSIEENLRRKMERGRYDPDKAPQAWQYLVDAGARKYCKEYRCSIRDAFPKPLREALAKDYAREFEDEEKIQGRTFNPAASGRAQNLARDMLI